MNIKHQIDRLVDRWGEAFFKEGQKEPMWLLKIAQEPREKRVTEYGTDHSRRFTVYGKGHNDLLDGQLLTQEGARRFEVLAVSKVGFFGQQLYVRGELRQISGDGIEEGRHP